MSQQQLKRVCLPFADHLIVARVVKPSPIPFDFIMAAYNLNCSRSRSGQCYIDSHSLGVQPIMIVTEVFLFRMVALLVVVLLPNIKFLVYPKTLAKESHFVDTRFSYAVEGADARQVHL